MRAIGKCGSLFLANTGAGLVYPLLHVVLSESLDAGILWRQFRFSMVYSWCIGTIAFLVMGSLGGRMWRLGRAVRVIAMTALLAAVGIVGTLIANLVLLGAGWTNRAWFWFQFRGSVRIAVAITIAVGLLVAGYESLRARLEDATLELQNRQLAEERALKLAGEARLSSLESRIHPHFLFNTLNSISALIREDPARAESTVERLAALLRYSLDAGGRRLAPLSQELRIVRDYLEIEQTRLGGRLRFELRIPEDFGALEVPPLALQSLVENSVKHAVAPSRQGGEITIEATLEAGKLELAVTDDGPGFDMRAAQAGHGIDNLRERLSALFGPAAHLELTRREGRMRVSVSIPQSKVL